MKKNRLISSIKSQLGLTITELLLTLLVFLIVTLLALPGFQSIIDNNRLRAAAQQFFSEMYQARSLAIQQNSALYVHINAGISWCYGFDNASQCNCTATNNCQINLSNKVINAGSSPLTISLNGLSSQFQIDGDQGMLSSTGSVDFTLNSKSIRANLSRLGRITLCSSDVGGLPAC